MIQLPNSLDFLEGQWNWMNCPLIIKNGRELKRVVIEEGNSYSFAELR